VVDAKKSQQQIQKKKNLFNENFTNTNDQSFKFLHIAQSCFDVQFCFRLSFFLPWKKSMQCLSQKKKCNIHENSELL